jgi:hypothetical protein
LHAVAASDSGDQTPPDAQSVCDEVCLWRKFYTFNSNKQPF